MVSCVGSKTVAVGHFFRVRNPRGIAGVFCHVRIMCFDVRSVGMLGRVLLGLADVGRSLDFQLRHHYFR